MKTVTGSIHMSYSINCPHCDNYIDDYYDREWWNYYFFEPYENTSDLDVECPECKKEFTITEFIL